MSWSHQGNKGTAQNKTPSTTLAIPVSASVTAGDLLVVWSCWDDHPGSPFPFGGGGVNFDAEYMNKVTDTQGNVYTQVCQIGQQGTGTGVRVAMYIGKLATALTTSDTVTIHSLPDGHMGSAAGANDITAKCASMHAFRSTLTGWARCFQYDYDVWAAASGDVPDLVVSNAWPNESHLILHILGVEGPNTDNYTWDADYTQITGTGTTGGADDSNVHVRGGWRIATVTGDTIGITSTTADRDLGHMMIALNEVNIPTGDRTFPQFDVIDDFSRADEAPLASRWWQKDPGGGGWGGTSFQTAADNFDLVSGEIVAATADVSTEPDSYGKYYWNDDVPCMYGEVWATLSGVPDDASESRPVPEPPTNYGRRGIGVGWAPEPGGGFGAAGYEVGYWRLGKFQGNDQLHFHFPGQFFRTQTYIGDMAAGDRIGLQMEAGRYFHTYYDKGAGWKYLHTHDVNNAGGSGIYVYFRPFRPCVRVGGRDCALDDFGGGHPCFEPDIIRRVQ